MPGQERNPQIPRKQPGDNLDQYVDTLARSVQEEFERGAARGQGVTVLNALPAASQGFRGRLVFIAKGSGGAPDELWLGILDGAGAPQFTQIV